VRERPLLWHILFRFVPDDIRMERPKHVAGILAIDQYNTQNFVL